MKYLFVLVALFANYSLAAEFAEEPFYTIVSQEHDSSIDEGKSEVQFIFAGGPVDPSDKIMYSVDDEEFEHLADENMKIELTLDAGKHNFQFALYGLYQEIEIRDLVFKSQQHTIVQLNFKEVESQPVLKKPVIYLYPEHPTEIQVNLDIDGRLLFTYPQYEDGWSFTADSTGSLTMPDEQTFNYLFWESEPTIAVSVEKDGFCMKGDEVLGFFEEQLDHLGFTSQEKADFISFWVPQMQFHSHVYIRFLLNEECDSYARLNISPTPDNVNRVYILWSHLENDIEVKAQYLDTFDRSGFDILEWGGQEFVSKVSVSMISPR